MKWNEIVKKKMLGKMENYLSEFLPSFCEARLCELVIFGIYFWSCCSFNFRKMLMCVGLCIVVMCCVSPKNRFADLFSPLRNNFVFAFCQPFKCSSRRMAFVFLTTIILMFFRYQNTKEKIQKSSVLVFSFCFV